MSYILKSFWATGEENLFHVAGVFAMSTKYEGENGEVAGKRNTILRINDSGIFETANEN